MTCLQSDAGGATSLQRLRGGEPRRREPAHGGIGLSVHTQHDCCSVTTGSRRRHGGSQRVRRRIKTIGERGRWRLESCLLVPASKPVRISGLLSDPCCPGGGDQLPELQPAEERGNERRSGQLPVPSSQAKRGSSPPSPSSTPGSSPATPRCCCSRASRPSLATCTRQVRSTVHRSSRCSVP